MVNFKRVLAKSRFGDPTLKVLGMKGHEPEYYLLGVEKSGTTTLHDYIIQHPDINPGRRKECFYFDKHYQKGSAWYRGNFPHPNSIDSTPTYYRDRKVLSRVPKNKKYVMILREPVARIESAYNMCYANGWDTRSFESILSYGLTPELSYVRDSIYVDRLMDVFEILGSVYVMFLEELNKDPIREMNRLFSAWGLKKYNVKPIPARLVGKYVTHVTDEQREILSEFFKPYNLKLEILLGKKLPWGTE